MKNWINNKIGAFLAVLTAILGFSVSAQASPVSDALGVQVGTMISDGGAVALLAIGIFAAVMAVRVIKKFASAGK